jgi:DNA-binding IscR family transcriptional regulator
MQHLVDLGPTTIEALSKAFQLNEEAVNGVVSELEKDDLVKNEDNLVHLKY